MTVICALHDSETDSIWLGSDRQAKVGNTIVHEAAEKWSLVGDFAVGLTGSWWVRFVIEDAMQGCETVWSLPEAVNTALSEHGYAPEVKDGEGPWRDQGIIVASNRPGDRGLWILEAGPCVLLPVPIGTFYALGIGMEFALGAAHALREAPAEQRMRAALEAAIRYSDGCGGEPWIRELRSSSGAAREPSRVEPERDHSGRRVLSAQIVDGSGNQLLSYRSAYPDLCLEDLERIHLELGRLERSERAKIDRFSSERRRAMRSE